MQAIELHARIDEKHRIQLQVPEDWPVQEVKVIVLMETPVTATATANKRIFGQFRGKVHMADDFDAELLDAFWLGEAS